MKVPFVDYKLYSQLKKEKPISSTQQELLEDGKSIIHTKSRSSTIVMNFTDKVISVYNGKKQIRVIIKPNLLGYKLGCFSLTKKMGTSIHNSIHNRKKKEKIRRKITQKKIRKTVVKKKVKINTKKKKKK